MSVSHTSHEQMAPSPHPSERCTSIDTQAARLAKGTAGRLGVFARYGLASGGTRRVERLLLLRRRAMDAESHGRTTAADFYWSEAHAEIDRLTRRPDTWREYVVAMLPDAGVPDDGHLDTLFRVFVRREFADAHLAYFFAWEMRDEERAYAHLAYLRRLRGAARWPPEEERRYVGPLTVREIRHRQQHGDHRTAVALASDLVARFPDVSAYQTALADAYRERAVAQLTKTATRRGRRTDARTLARALFTLKKMRVERPHNLTLFESIARLHLARAETLAAGGALAEALVDTESALTYSPGIDGGLELRSRLEAEMQARRVEAAARDDSPKRRTRDDEYVRQQTAKGFRLVEAFRRSDEARAVADDLPIARGRLEWEAIGLPALEAIDHRPLALNDAIQTILNAPPQAATGLPESWHHVSEDNPHLQTLEGGRICAYLRYRLFGEPFTPAVGDVVPYQQTPATLNVDAPVRSSEPFVFWAFSRRNPLVKLELAAAAALAVVAVVLGSSEIESRRVRSEAYASLREARSSGRYDAMLDAAERFLSRQPIGADDRVAEVEAIYNEALVRWFNETAPPPDEADRRIASYRRLLPAADEAGR